MIRPVRSINELSKEDKTMARKKGSKNRPKLNDLDSINAQIVEKLNQKSALEEETEALTAGVAEARARLREIKRTQKKLEKNIAALESMREELGAAKQMEQALTELQPKINALLASGKSIEEIMDMLEK